MTTLRAIGRLATLLGWERQWSWTQAHGRGLVIAATLGLGGGLAVSFVLPDNFTVTLFLQPSAGDSPQLSGNLAAIASKFGVRPNVENSPLDFFALLLKSDTLLRTLLRAPLASPSTAARSASMLAGYYGFEDGTDEEGIALAVKQLRKDLSVNSDLSTGTVSVSLELTDPSLALTAARALVVIGNRYLEQMNAERYQRERVFLEAQVSGAQADMTAQEEALQRFYEQNRDFTQSPLLKVQESRLSRRVQIAQGQYLTLSDQLSAAHLAEARNAPVLAMVDPGVLPPPPGFLRRIAIGILTSLAALLFWAGFVLVRSLGTQAPARRESP